MNEPVIVIDFETTGLGNDSDRVIEAAGVLVEDGEITRSFQSLANPGRRIPAFIEHFTGISNAMVSQAPPTSEVMARFADFLGDYPLVAHNASFDRGFLTAELRRLRRNARQDFLCTLLLSRRILRGLPSYKLAQVAHHLEVPVPRDAHRALADAEMAARVFIDLSARLRNRLGLARMDHRLLLQAQAIAPASFERRMWNLAEGEEKAATTGAGITTKRVRA